MVQTGVSGAISPVLGITNEDDLSNTTNCAISEADSHPQQAIEATAQKDDASKCGEAGQQNRRWSFENRLDKGCAILSQHAKAPACGHSGAGGKKLVMPIIYMALSIGTVYTNRLVLSDDFRYPVFVTAIQQVSGLIAYTLFHYLLSGTSGESFFPMRRISIPSLYRLFPMAIAFVAMVVTSTACLCNSLITTYQLSRSTTLIVTVGLAAVLGQQKLDIHSLLACSIVFVGFSLKAFDGSAISYYGTLFGLLSSAAQGLYNVMIKSGLKQVDYNVHLLLFYNLAFSSVLLIPCIFFFNEADVPQAFTASRVLGIFISAVLAFCLNLATFFCVKYTSPVSFNIIGVLKSCLQTAGGVVFFRETLSMRSALGVFLTLSGSALYGLTQYIKSSEPDKKPLLSGVAANPISYDTTGEFHRPVKTAHAAEANVLPADLATTVESHPRRRPSISPIV